MCCVWLQSCVCVCVLVFSGGLAGVAMGMSGACYIVWGAFIASVFL